MCKIILKVVSKNSNQKSLMTVSFDQFRQLASDMLSCLTGVTYNVNACIYSTLKGFHHGPLWPVTELNAHSDISVKRARSTCLIGNIDVHLMALEAVLTYRHHNHLHAVPQLASRWKWLPDEWWLYMGLETSGCQRKSCRSAKPLSCRAIFLQTWRLVFWTTWHLLKTRKQAALHRV